MLKRCVKFFEIFKICTSGLYQCWPRNARVDLAKHRATMQSLPLVQWREWKQLPIQTWNLPILYSDPTIGDKISYFRELTHFLHFKVLNLGETILPALGIEELNNFQSEHTDSWFYDSETPHGISFDGAMPWASKTPLGRRKTKNKPALELIRTPEKMAKFQEEEVAVKEGYHLGKTTWNAFFNDA